MYIFGAQSACTVSLEFFAHIFILMLQLLRIFSLSYQESILFLPSPKVPSVHLHKVMLPKSITFYFSVFRWISSFFFMTDILKKLRLRMEKALPFPTAISKMRAVFLRALNLVVVGAGICCACARISQSVVGGLRVA